MAAAPQLDPVTLPFDHVSPNVRVSSASAALGAAARRRPLRATDTADTERLAILVVEPDERTRSLLHVGLSREGFDVLAAASSEEALRYLSPERPLPAMIFCEADLRGGDGFSLCQNIRSDQRTADLPVVLLSRNPESFYRELAGGAGADEFLPKPLYLNDVISLATLMAGRSSSEARFYAETQSLPMVHALRALLSGVRSGRIELSDTRAHIAFREGRVVDAAFDGLDGQDALLRMLLLAEGEYVVSFGPSLTRASMTFGLEDLCRRMLPRLQRWHRLLSRCVPLEATLVVDFAQLKDVLSTLPDEVNALLRLFDGHRRVRDVVMTASLDEITALEAITRLYAMALLSPLAHVDAPSHLDAAEVPAFFEPATGSPEASSPGLHDALFGDVEWLESSAARAPNIAPAQEALDPQLLQQLDAFRIKPVVEARSPAIREPAVEAELSHFARSEATEPEPSPMAQAFADQAPIALVEVVDAQGSSTAIDADPNASVFAEVAYGPAQTESKFFSDGEVTADLTPAAARRAHRSAAYGPVLLGVGVIATAALAIAFWPRAAKQPMVLEPLVVTSEPEAAQRPAQVAALPATTQSAPTVAPAGGGAVSGETLPTAALAAAAPPVLRAAPAVAPTPTAPPALEEASRLYTRQQYRQAITVLEGLTTSEPRHAAAWVLLGLSRFDNGDAKGAETATMKALEVEPANGRAIILLASIHLDAGQKAKARAELQRYLELHPKGPFAQEARDLLRQ